MRLILHRYPTPIIRIDRQQLSIQHQVQTDFAAEQEVIVVIAQQELGRHAPRLVVMAQLAHAGRIDQVDAKLAGDPERAAGIFGERADTADVQLLLRCQLTRRPVFQGPDAGVAGADPQ